MPDSHDGVVDKILFHTEGGRVVRKSILRLAVRASFEVQIPKTELFPEASIEDGSLEELSE